MKKLTITFLILIVFAANSFSKDNLPTEEDIDKAAKTLDVLVGLVPNTDGLLDGKGEFNINYTDLLRSGIFYYSNSYIRIDESDEGKKKTTRTYLEKTYGVNVIGIQDGQLKIFDFLYLSGNIGLSYHTSKETIDGKDFTTVDRLFYTETRESDFIEPKIDLDISLPFSDAFTGKIYTYIIPVAMRTTTGEAEYSNYPQPFKNDTEDTTIELFAGLEFNLKLSDGFDLLLGFDYRRQVGVYLATKIDGTGNFTYQDFDYTDHTYIPKIGFGLGFLKEYLSGIKPILMISYFLNQRDIVGSRPEEDETIKSDQFRFGFLFSF